MESEQRFQPDADSFVEQIKGMEQISAPASLLPDVLNRLGLGAARFPAEASTNELLTALSDAQWATRVAAVRALGKHRSDAVKEPLLATLKDENAFVRVAALQALGEHLPMGALKEALHDEHQLVRDVAHRVLEDNFRLHGMEVVEQRPGETEIQRQGTESSNRRHPLPKRRFVVALNTKFKKHTGQPLSGAATRADTSQNSISHGRFSGAQTRVHRSSRFATIVNALAAVLVVGIIVGGFLLTLKMIRPGSQVGGTASAHDFVGTWQNVDPNTRSWVRIEITLKGNPLTAHFFGACHPSPCDAGSTSAPFEGNPLHLHLTHSFATRDLTLSLADNILSVTTFTHYTDNSGKSDYTSHDDFYLFLKEFKIPTAANGDVGSVTTGPDGNLWFTEYYSDMIGRLTPQGTVTEFPTPTPRSRPNTITSCDGNLWFTENFTENQNSQIGRITPLGTITEFSTPTQGALNGIACGLDGNLWFGETGSNKIGRITPWSPFQCGCWLAGRLLRGAFLFRSR